MSNPPSSSAIFNQHKIDESASVRDALVQLDKLRGETLFVTSSEEKLLGTLTDGDIRRLLVAGGELSDSVSSGMNRNFRSFREGAFNNDDLNDLREKGLRFVPVLNDAGGVAELLDLTAVRAVLPMDAIIMAGGRGQRLRPMTDQTPKPLLQIGDKPIIEYNVDRLQLYGVRNLHISVKYLAEQLEDYFKDGSDRGMNIQYIHEDEPLGTIGAASMVEEFENDYVLVMNSDLLTNIDFEQMFNTLVESGASMAMATVPYEVQIPYAVIETENEHVQSFAEKPTYTYYSNAGIYMMKRSVIDLIPKGEHFNATDLVEKVIASGEKVKPFSILGYWLDIGKPEDFAKAQVDIKRIHL